VQNDRVNRTRRTTLAAALVTGALVVSGCSGSSSSSTPAADGSTPPTPHTPSASSSTPDSSGSSPPQSSTAPPTGVVDGVRLTFPGSKLKVGDAARVSWNPDQKTTGVIKVAVTKLEKVPISTFSDFRLRGTVRRSTPYFVHATVTNLGKSDLSHAAVPLYLLDARNTLLQPSRFLALFPPCPSRPLPGTFTRGKKASVCLVYFAPHHGKLVAISFRPTEDFDAITWTGKISKPRKG
jgi:hypothetical protein